MFDGSDVRSLRLAAAAALRNGSVARATAAFERLVAASPERADDWFNLGYLRRRAGRWTDALAAYAEALARGVSRPEEVHLNRAVILSEHLLDVDAAAAELGRALDIAPDYTPALLNLGNLWEDKGERTEARRCYAHVLKVESNEPRALGRLAETARTPDEIATALRDLGAALAQRDVSNDDRAELLFARGRALERAGRHQKAFADIREANALARSVASAAGWTYDRNERERMIDAVLADPIRSVTAGGGSAPTFLCGMFRSGSTVLEQVLAAHPAVCAGGELDALPRIVADRFPSYPSGLEALHGSDLDAVRAIYLSQLERLGCDGRMPIDKRPDNILYLGLAKRLFPTAKVLITRRDPLDTVLSNYFLRFDDSVSYSFHLEDAAHWLVQERRLAAHWLGRFPGDVMEIDYDALVADPAPVITQALGFLGLPWDDACLRSHERGAVIRTPSGWQAREPLHRRSSGRWRRYEAEMEPAISVLRRAGLVGR